MKSKSFKTYASSLISVRIPVSSRPSKVIIPLKGKGSYRRQHKYDFMKDHEDQACQKMSISE